MHRVLLTLLLASAWADAVHARGCKAPEEKKQLSRLHLAGGDAADEARKWWFDISVAPDITRHRALRSDTGEGDATELSWTVGTDFEPSKGVEVEVEFGPGATTDSDDDSEESSTLSFSTRIFGSPDGAGRVKPFVGYGVEIGYEGFFDAHDNTEHVVEAGLAFKCETLVDYALEVGARSVWSDRKGEDYLGLRMAGELDFTLVEDALSFHVDVEGQRRWYRGAHPDILSERRDWRVEAFAGFDVSQWLNRALHLPDDQQVVSDATLGFRWAEFRSNVAGEEESNLRLAPSFAIRVHF